MPLRVHGMCTRHADGRHMRALALRLHCTSSRPKGGLGMDNPTRAGKGPWALWVKLARTVRWLVLAALDVVSLAIALAILFSLRLTW